MASFKLLPSWHPFLKHIIAKLPSGRNSNSLRNKNQTDSILRQDGSHTISHPLAYTFRVLKQNVVLHTERPEVLSFNECNHRILPQVLSLQSCATVLRVGTHQRTLGSSQGCQARPCSPPYCCTWPPQPSRMRAHQLDWIQNISATPRYASPVTKRLVFRTSPPSNLHQHRGRAAQVS